MIVKLFNIIFRIFLIFLICFIWVRYFVDELWLSLLYSTLLTISIELIIHFFLIKKKSKRKLKTEDEKLAERISTTFIFSQKLCLDYFQKLAKIKYSVKKLSKYILINDLDHSNENKTALFPLYSYSPIAPQNLVEINNYVGKQNISKLVVCGYKIDPATYKLAEKIKDYKIILLNSNDCYSQLIKPYNFYPDNLKDLNLQEKIKFKEILKMSLARRNSKGYLISSLILLFSSFVVRMNIYYVIMSSLLLTLSLLSFFLPKKDLKMKGPVL